MKHNGNLKITKQNQNDYKDLTEVGGDLYIYSNAELKAENLKSVGGDLSINSNAELKNLKSVGGYLYINSNAELKNLKSVGGYLSINSNAELKAENLKSVGGYLYIYSNAELKAENLKSVGGYLYINSKLDEELERQLWKNNRGHKWRMTDRTSDFLLSKKGKITYKIEDVDFGKKLFDSVRKDTLSAKQVFNIRNIEQRRIAYQKMDKLKMKQLDDFKVLEEVKDGQENTMKLVEFSLKKYGEPFRFLNCICPSTGREYFLETRSKTCQEAKAKSFGFVNVEFDEEW